MSLPRRLITPLLSATLLATSVPVIAEEVIATVNGSTITTEDYQRFVFEATQGKGGKVNPNDVLSELLSRELIHQDALKQKLDKRKDISEELERLKYKLVVGVALDELIKKNPITEKELQALYDKEIKTLKLKEYKARHILVKEKTRAEQLITELDLGGDFATLAKKNSTDTGSAKNGGDLGWFKPQAMVPEFSNATALLEKGKYTKVPVQSQFGWHVIKLEDSRDVAPPTFEQVKKKLTKHLQRQRVNTYVKSLEEKADIQITQK